MSHIENLADIDLDSGRYLIQSGKTTLAMLFRNSDGSYSVNPEEIALPAHSHELMVNMVDDLGDSPASQLVTLWDPTEEVSIFDYPLDAPYPGIVGWHLGRNTAC